MKESKEFKDFKSLAEALEYASRYRVDINNYKSGILNNPDFDSVVDQAYSIIKKYHSDYTTLLEKCTKDTFKILYNQGGGNLYRGYYCPSPIEDIVVSNCKRGKLYSTVPRVYAYKFHFNSDNQLISAFLHDENVAIDTFEYIFYLPDTCFGVQFSAYGYINHIAISKYQDSKIIQFNLMNLSWQNDDVFSVLSIHTENYQYEDGKLKYTEEKEFYSSIPVIIKKEYEFFHDDNGYLNSYKMIDGQNHVYQQKIKIKRKI